jgi:hypothetical protein
MPTKKLSAFVYAMEHSPEALRELDRGLPKSS